MKLSLASLLALPTLIRSCIAISDYHESLHLRPLAQNALLASFEFKSNATLSSFEHQNFRYFPRSLGQILQHAHTEELHLRFSLGRWDDEAWGNRPWDGSREGGTGVELWAWVNASSDEEYGRNVASIGSRTNDTKGRCEMADSHQRAVWPVLRLTQLHRFYKDNTSGQHL